MNDRQRSEILTATLTVLERENSYLRRKLELIQHDIEKNEQEQWRVIKDIAGAKPGFIQNIVNKKSLLFPPKELKALKNGRNNDTQQKMEM